MFQVNRRKFLQGIMSVVVVAAFVHTLLAQVSDQDQDPERFTRPSKRPDPPSLTMRPGGKFVEATVPDTLDLAYRAELATNALTGTLDPEHNYEVYQLCVPGSDYPYFTHENTGFPTINPKYAEAMVMMRVMSGSEQNLEHQTKMMAMMLSRIKPPWVLLR